MNKVLLIILVCLSVESQGQLNPISSIAYDSAVLVTIRGGENHLNLLQLNTGFQIQLSDTSGELLRFEFVYFFRNDTSYGLNRILVQDNMARVNKDYPIYPDEAFVTIENVLFRRAGKIYRAKSIIVPIEN